MLFGIIGGMGPKASAEFYDKYLIGGRVKLFEAMKLSNDHVFKCTSARWTEEEISKVHLSTSDQLTDQDHPPVILYSASNTPDRVNFLTGKSKDSPATVLTEVVQQLVKAGATKICFTCNTAHYFIPQIQATLKENDVQAEFLNMIELSLEYIVRTATSPIAKVGVLSTVSTAEMKIYESITKTLNQDLHNIEYAYPDNTGKQNVQRVICAIKSAKVNITEKKGMSALIVLIKESLDLIEKQACTAVILGCTELPLLLTTENIEYFISQKDTPDVQQMLQKSGISSSSIQKLPQISLINPGQILADEIIRQSLLSKAR